MYACPWLVLCETVVHDKTSNNLTMVNALTALRAVEFPAVHPRFAFAAILRREGEPEGPLSLRFIRETESGDEALLTINGNDQAPERVQFYTNFPVGIRLFEDGVIKFRLEVREGESDWYTVGSQTIEVSSVEQQGRDSQVESGVEEDVPAEPGD